VVDHSEPAVPTLILRCELLTHLRDIRGLSPDDKERPLLDLVHRPGMKGSYCTDPGLEFPIHPLELGLERFEVFTDGTIGDLLGRALLGARADMLKLGDVARNRG